MTMRTIVWILAAAALAVGGCSKRKPSKRERCERVLGEMMGGMIAGLSAGLGDPDDPETKCMKANLRHPEKCMAPDEAADYKVKLAELVGQCEQWPDETLDCFRTFSDSPACERAFAALSGLQVSEVKAEGPPPAWEATIDGDEDIAEVVAGDGGAYALAGDRVVAIAAGKVAWQAEVPGLDAVVPGACVLAIGDEVVCLDPKTGAVAWTGRGAAALAEGDPDDLEDPDDVDDLDTLDDLDDLDDGALDATRWRLAAWRGASVLLVGDGGAVGVVDPSTCAAGPCVTVKAPLPGADDSYPLTRSLVVRRDGAWAYIDDRHLYLVGPDDAPTGRLAVDNGDDDGFVTALAVTPAGAIVAGWGRSIYRIDPAACTGGLDGDALRADAAPEGCVTTLADRTEEAGDGYAPLPLGEDGVAFTVGSEVHVWRAGKKAWAADVRSAAGLLRAGDDAVLAAMGELDGPPEVRRVALGDGATTWRTRLAGFPRVGILELPVAATDGQLVYIGYKDRVAAVPVAPAKGP